MRCSLLVSIALLLGTCPVVAGLERPAQTAPTPEAAANPALPAASATVPATRAAEAEPPDPFLWLETLDSTEVRAWVEEANRRSTNWLAGLPEYGPAHARAKERLERVAADPGTRLQPVSTLGDMVIQVHGGAGSIGGVIRRATWPEYAAGKEQWATLLDLDELATADGTHWMAGRNFNLSEAPAQLVCLGPENRHCLVFLSPGGSDASIAREFDAAKPGGLVAGGFSLPVARSAAVWVDSDSLLVGTDFGPNTLSPFKTPLSVRLWQRGTPITDAKVVLSAEPGQLALSPRVLHDRQGRFFLIERYLDFFRRESWYWRPGIEAVRLPLASENVVLGVFEGQLLVLLRRDLEAGGAMVPSGSIVSIDLQGTLATGAPSGVASVFVPSPRQAVQTATAPVQITATGIYVSIIDDVSGRLLRAERRDGAWTSSRVELPDFGTIGVVAGNPSRNEVLVAFTDLITPASVYLVRGRGEVRKVRSLPAMVDASRLTVEQRFAVSKDGARIPYFIARPQQLALDGTRPALLTGYGGFGSTLVPTYLGGQYFEIAVAGLLERGGSFVVANLRGGAEYGPAWHQAAILENKQKTWDDFTAVAQDLIRQRFTSPSRLGIAGLSHAGLLVGVALTQHPELYRAVWCEVAGLDMLRFHKLGSSGAMAEYGDPDDPKMHQVIRAYSPYQNLSEHSRYPAVFFYTNSKDDRVHPGHARKMYARMRTLKADAYFFESEEGGHGGSGGIEAAARRHAMMAAFLLNRLLADPLDASRKE